MNKILGRFGEKPFAKRSEAETQNKVEIPANFKKSRRVFPIFFIQ
jgi:hypothetical protein